MRVILLRHGSRSTAALPHGFADDLGDSPLNARGQAQADLLAQSLAPQGPLPQPSRLISSPKRRAKQTLTPLSESTHIQLEIEPRLDERHQHETGADFDRRIRAFLNELTALEPQLPKDATIYLCSHLDWLESAMILMSSDNSDREMAASWTNCEYRQFRVTDQIWSLLSGGVIHHR